MTVKNSGEFPADKISKESPVDTDAPTENDSSLQSLVGEEQTYARERMRAELGREPTEAEADEWLAAHTEGY